uniref:protein FLUORESCENT IN BLUE LIGHT, chloroplastic-like n=1 Tax=Erigeron canadensis TaxID=72917 RepID=UPI001CB8F56B|nr:protein FLUORESCENT IN BLUE LIGHT, chloroplastic-like [Erigeron canadensis]
MTVVAGCSSSCLISRPISFPPSHTTSAGSVLSLVIDVHNLVFHRDDCTRTFKARRILLGVSAVSKKLSRFGETDYGVVDESSTLQQRTGLVGSLQAGAVIANALLLTTPLEALAETCEAPLSVFNMNMPLLLLVALIGATVGGLLARQRKAELLRLNEQLRQINTALKRQAKIESYAPALSYAPAAARVSENEVIVDPKKQELISHLKKGKNFLRNQNPDKAFFEFKTALELAQNIKDHIEEKKAARGLGASLQRQGKHQEAIKYHSMVLSISEREGEDSGNTEAFGAIADCYTELGDLERAATYYDQYIARLQAD